MSKLSKESEPKKVPRRAPLTDQDKELMMLMLLRNPIAFDRAKELLSDEHFGAFHVGYNLVWSVVKAFHDDYEAMPEMEFVQAGLASRLAEAPGTLNPDEEQELNELVVKAYTGEWESDPKSESCAKWTIDTVQRFMHEGLARKVKDTVLSSRGRIIADMPAMLAAAQEEAEQIDALADGAPPTIFPEGWDKTGGINMVKSGISFLDNFYNGGMAPGEVYGILGPYGSCKTTLAVMLAVEAARRAHYTRSCADWDGRYGLSFAFSYEARLENELRIRILSYAAHIHRVSLERMGPEGMATLSTSANPKSYKDYEKLWYKAKQEEGLGAKHMPGERERIEAVTDWLNDHLVIVDMTGFDPQHRGAGSAGIPEIARIINTELRRRRAEGYQPYVEHVAIDYVGALARRLLAAVGKDEAYLRHFIGNTPLQAKHRIADQFNCPVHLFHQLSGKANDNGPTRKMHHTDAAESKNFAENLDFCIGIGTPTEPEALCRFDCTKHRRAPVRPAEIVEIVGWRNEVRSTNGKYVLDPNDGSIKLAADVHAMVTKQQLKKASKAKPAVPAASLAEYNPLGPDGWGEWSEPSEE